MSDKDQTKIIDIIGNVLGLMDIAPEQHQVVIDADVIKVQLFLPEEQSGIFIGHRGETINSLQLLLSLIISQRLGDWHKVKLNIGDYQERREEAILGRADQAVARAIATGQEIVIPGLNAFERHLIHEHLTNHPQVATESRGTPPYRQLYITLKA